MAAVPYLLRPKIVTSINEGHESVGLKSTTSLASVSKGVMKGETFSSTLGFDVEVEVFVLV